MLFKIKEDIFFDNIEGRLIDNQNNVIMNSMKEIYEKRKYQSFNYKKRTPRVLKVVFGYNCNFNCEYCCQKQSKDDLQTKNIDNFLNLIIDKFDLSNLKIIELWGRRTFTLFWTNKNINENISKYQIHNDYKWFTIGRKAF